MQSINDKICYIFIEIPAWILLYAVIMPFLTIRDWFQEEENDKKEVKYESCAKRIEEIKRFYKI